MRYSLRNKNIERKNRKKSALYIILTIVTIFLIFFVGVKVLVRIINTITDLKQSDVIKNSGDDIPPQIPRISSPSEYTNSSDLEIVGDGEPASNIILYLNDKKQEVLAGNEGKFVFKIRLEKGENIIYLKSVDDAGNSSSNTRSFKVIYDNTPPDLQIGSPANGSTFYGSKNKTVEIKGQSDSESKVTVNGKYAYVSDNGTFSILYELGDGENRLNVLSVDPAGNETLVELILNYQN